MDEHAPSPFAPWRRLLEAGLVAGIAFLAVVPYLHYLTRVAFAHAVQRRFAGIPLSRVLEADLALIGVLVAICALAGSLLARRYHLAGFGNLTRLRSALPWILPAGVLLAGGTYGLFGRHLAARVPGYYPSSLGWATLTALKGALFDETVARFGVMTIVAGGARYLVGGRPTLGVWLANLLQAALFSWLTFRGLPFFGVDITHWSPLLASSLVASLVVHLSLGFVYGRWGLLASTTMHGAIDLKYPLHALLS